MVNRIETSFVDRLAGTRLLSADQLAAAQAAAPGGDKALAEYLVRKGLLTRFQANQVRAGARTLQVGKYVVVDCLGRGGNGVVFKARHTLMPNRFVALKTLDTRNLHRSPEGLTRFRREIDIVALLDHPNVVRAYDVLQTRSQLYLVLEYIAGQDLGTTVRERGPLPVGEAVDYTIQAARGLAYAHRSGVVHRDLKPANLLLTDTGVVKLTDLGLARLYIDPSPELTLKGLCIGTPEFMAPEQAEDSSGADIRSDLYSLGATLFHLLTAELTVNGSSYLHRLQQLLMTPPRPLGQARKDVPTGLAGVVDRLRARDPQDRPGNAEEAITLLEPYARRGRKETPAPWDSSRKAGLVLQVLRGQLSAAEACGLNHLAAGEFETWQERFLDGGEKALDPAQATASMNTYAIRDLHAQIGAQAMEIQALKKRLARLGAEEAVG
jgi:serine/threonine protein kinase